MKFAKGTNNTAGFATGVILTKDDGTEPTEEEYAAELARVEEEQRKRIENAVQMEGSPRDVAYFPLNLSMGDISDPISDARAAQLQNMVLIGGPNFSRIGQELVDAARRSLKTLQSNPGPVRIWTSRNPDEFCGFCHILTLLPEDADIRVVELPEYEVRGNELVRYTGWGEVDPFELGRMQSRERRLTDTERRCFIALWRELQRENGPLRAVVNGSVQTVGADFYDRFILRELQKQPRRFHEGRLIGEVLGRHQLGIGDSLIALRLEELISRGMLTPVTEPEPDRPIYHRYLEKQYN